MLLVTKNGVYISLGSIDENTNPLIAQQLDNKGLSVTDEDGITDAFRKIKPQSLYRFLTEYVFFDDGVCLDDLFRNIIVPNQDAIEAFLWSKLQCSLTSHIKEISREPSDPEVPYYDIVQLAIGQYHFHWMSLSDEEIENNDRIITLNPLVHKSKTNEDLILHPKHNTISFLPLNEIKYVPITLIGTLVEKREHTPANKWEVSGYRSYRLHEILEIILSQITFWGTVSQRTLTISKTDVAEKESADKLNNALQIDSEANSGDDQDKA